MICPSHETQAALHATPRVGRTARGHPDGVSGILFSTASTPKPVPTTEPCHTCSSLAHSKRVKAGYASCGASRTEPVHATRPTCARRPPRLGHGGLWTRWSVTDTLRSIFSPTDDALVRLYASAPAVVFDSRMEGFGLPVAEGLAVGTPVIASNLACIEGVRW